MSERPLGYPPTQVGLIELFESHIGYMAIPAYGNCDRENQDLDAQGPEALNECQHYTAPFKQS